MKRLASIGFLAVYFALSIGVNVLIHTCGGYRSVDVFPISAADPCGACMDGLSDEMCCTLVLQTLHIEDDQKVAVGAPVSSPDYAFVDYPSLNQTPDEAFRSSPVPVDTSPPTDIASNILNCVFLI